MSNRRFITVLYIVFAFCVFPLYGQQNIRQQEQRTPVKQLGERGIHLVILHTNDTHSQITPQVAGGGKGLGGYERREAYINKVRSENENVLLLDAGDFSQGTPYFSIFKGDVEIELMNALKYDASCIGNHEFDNGQAELARRIKNADFPVLCANYDFSTTPLKEVKPYTIVEKGGLKIGIIGITTNLKGLVSAANLNDITFIHPVKVMNKYALELKRNHKCDLIIVLSHCGFSAGPENNPGDEALAAKSENVDIIVGGHSHTRLTDLHKYKNMLGKDVIVVQDGEKGEYVGRLDLWF